MYACFDTTADFLGLINGEERPTAQIFVIEKKNVEDTEQNRKS